MPLRFSRLRPARVRTAALTGHGVTPGGADSGQAARMPKPARGRGGTSGRDTEAAAGTPGVRRQKAAFLRPRSEEHTSELQSLMRTSSAVFCLKKKKLLTKDIA